MHFFFLMNGRIKKEINICFVLRCVCVCIQKQYRLSCLSPEKLRHGEKDRIVSDGWFGRMKSILHPRGQSTLRHTRLSVSFYSSLFEIYMSRESTLGATLNLNTMSQVSLSIHIVTMRCFFVMRSYKISISNCVQCLLPAIK